MNSVMNKADYYASDEYTQSILERVGMNQEAIDLNTRFAHDIYNECMKEYMTSQDPMAFAPLTDMKTLFAEMVDKSLALYHQTKNTVFGELPCQ